MRKPTRMDLIMLATLLTVGAAIFRTDSRAEVAPATAARYEIIDNDLEPFRSAFDDASDHVRAVLLVGPT